MGSAWSSRCQPGTIRGAFGEKPEKVCQLRAALPKLRQHQAHSWQAMASLLVQLRSLFRSPAASPRRQRKGSSVGPCAWLAAGCLSGALAGCQPGSGPEPPYPSRLIELIVPWAAGGGTDRVARLVADALQKRLGQPVIVVNRTGGSGAVGHSAGALAPPDGYTVTMATFELSTMKSMGISGLTWRDFAPITQVNADAAAILVRNDASWKNLPELLEAIRQNPNRLKMSGTSTGGSWDLARSGLLLAAGIPPAQVIWAPTQGAAPALVELLGGHVDAVCCSVPEAASQLQSGQVRLLAVLGPERLQDFPQYPTAREQGVDYDAVGWRGLMLPKDTPAEVIARLSAALVDVADSEGFRAFMSKNGFAVQLRGPQAFAAFLEAEEAKWRKVIESAGYESLGQNHDPGPRIIPLLLLVALLITVAIEWSRLARGGQEVPLTDSAAAAQAGHGSARAAAVMVALAVYLVLMPRLGFALTTIPFAGLLMVWLGARWWAAALGSTGMVLAIHALFVVLFKVQLP